MFEQETLKNIRNKNLSNILNVLRTRDACSLAELTENTDGGLTTVKKCVLQALELGMIIEGDVADSTGGRKAKQYLINEKYQYLICFIVDNNDLVVKVYNFKYECIEEYSQSININDFFDVVCGCVDRALEKYEIGTVCLSMPCVVKDGIILDWYYNQSLKNFNIKAELESKYSLNTIVQNDMKLSALGESVKKHNGLKNIVTMQFGHNGIGMAGIVNGHLLEGNSGFAGEISYINDITKNIMSISYPAKIVKNAIVFLNPEIIVFYNSKRQNKFSQIFSVATGGLPSYAIPKFEVSNDYVNDIIDGLLFLVDKYGFFRKVEK